MLNGHGVAKFLLRRAVRDAGIKVVFTGEGADEMLAGYAPFRRDALNPIRPRVARKEPALMEKMFGANAATALDDAGATGPSRILQAASVDSAGCRELVVAAWGRNSVSPSSVTFS